MSIRTVYRAVEEDHLFLLRELYAIGVPVDGVCEGAIGWGEEMSPDRFADASLVVGAIGEGVVPHDGALLDLISRARRGMRLDVGHGVGGLEEGSSGGRGGQEKVHGRRREEWRHLGYIYGRENACVSETRSLPANKTVRN